MEHLATGNHIAQLANAVKLFPTPMARDYKSPDMNKDSNLFSKKTELNTFVVMFPTPTTGAGMCGGTGNYQQLKRLESAGIISEEERRSMAQGNGGQLNPTWVEWLMGFPLGWTDLSASETQSCPSSSTQSSGQ